jgi:hypothetical protein
MYGYKFFSKNYTIGETYETSEDVNVRPIIYYFNTTPYDIIYQYKLYDECAENNTYFLVEIVGDIIMHHHDKFKAIPWTWNTDGVVIYSGITNKIKIIKEMTENEMIEHFISNQLAIGNGSDEVIKEAENIIHKISITLDGDIFLFKNNVLHSFNDLPAIKRKYGMSGFHINHNILDSNIYKSSDNNQIIIPQHRFNVWYTDGQIHRDNDLPAITYFNGSKWANLWIKNGLNHRDNELPAYIDHRQSIWYYNGLKHRDNDLPAVMDETVNIWYKHGKIHRGDDLPAKEFIWGDKEWYLDGKQYDNNTLEFDQYMLDNQLDPLQQICDQMTPIVLNLKEFIKDDELKTTINKTIIMSKYSEWIQIQTTAYSIEQEYTDELFCIKCSFVNNRMIISQVLGDIHRGSFLPEYFVDKIKTILSQYVKKFDRKYYLNIN